MAGFPRTDGSKVFNGASELQLDCVVEENSGGAPAKLALTDLSDDFPTPPHNGPVLPVEPSDIKLDPAAADTSASSGERTAADSDWQVAFQTENIPPDDSAGDPPPV